MEEESCFIFISKIKGIERQTDDNNKVKHKLMSNKKDQKTYVLYYHLLITIIIIIKF